VGVVSHILTELWAERSALRILAGVRDLSLLKTSDQLWNPPSLIFNRYQR